MTTVSPSGMNAIPEFEDVSAAFVAAYGTSPRGVWSAPGRVNLIGEHTDYNRGLVLPFAIDRRTTCALSPRPDRVIRVMSSYADKRIEMTLDDLDEDLPRGWSAYPLGVAWALLALAPNDVRGVDIAICSDVPIGAGLSSSAAIECSVALALDDVWHLGLEPMQLAFASQRAENVVVGAPTGVMDQTASMLGRADHAVLLDCDTFASEVIPLGLEAAGIDVMVIDARVEHAHATGGYADRRAACERGATTLGAASLRGITEDDLPRAEATLDEVTFRRVRHVVTENARVAEAVIALKAGDISAMGELMLASHASMRDDFEISVPAIDAAVEAAMEAGAMGARLTGGGFGGASIALVPHGRFDDIAEAIERALVDGSHPAPCIFPVRPSDGARRDA